MTLLAILMLVAAGLIYYSTHKIPPDPLFKKDTYVTEDDFWDDMEESDFTEQKIKPLNQVQPELKKGPSTPLWNWPTEQEIRHQEKLIKKRRKRRRIAKKSRQQNRN